VLEISTREGNLAVGQLEEAKKRLCNTQNQLDAMSDSHARTLSRLETAKVSPTHVVARKPMPPMFHQRTACFPNACVLL
jgi:hypothetical protein